MACRLILADNHRFFREGLKILLGNKPNFMIVGEVSDYGELIDCLGKLSPDLILIDLFRPGLRGIETIPEIRRLCPDVKILVLTMHREEAYISRALAAGADGYLLKEGAYEEVFPAIESIQQGRKYIAPILRVAGTKY